MLKIYSPLDGKIKELEKVNDIAFSQKMLGDGIAIVPEKGELFSPIQGTVTMLFPTKHAIGLTSREGIEILIHIGIDTVEMNGEGFFAFVKQGETVDVGDTLISFDLEKIQKEGYDIDTMVIITNKDSYQHIVATDNKKLKVGEELLEIK